jgi:hypothetical protein
MADVRKLAISHPDVDPRWITERRDRYGRPRIRPKPPVPTTGNTRKSPATGLPPGVDPPLGVPFRDRWLTWNGFHPTRRKPACSRALGVSMSTRGSRAHSEMGECTGAPHSSSMGPAVSSRLSLDLSRRLRGRLDHGRLRRVRDPRVGSRSRRARIGRRYWRPRVRGRCRRSRVGIGKSLRHARTIPAAQASANFPRELPAPRPETTRGRSVVALYLQARKKVQSSTRLLTRDLLALA